MTRHEILSTPRLVLRLLEPDDAAFIHALVNDPDWLRYIGERNVRSLDDARGYIANGPAAMFARHGFALFAVERREDGVPIGICGILKRDYLDAPDLGFAFLPAHRSRGYAREAAEATLAWGLEAHGIRRMLATTALDNDASVRLLEKLGFRFERTARMPGDANDVKLFAWTAR
jgi:ribosomal-protein-alanine N-acetyltransferase